MMLLASIAVLVHVNALVSANSNVTSGSITPPEVTCAALDAPKSGSVLCYTNIASFTKDFCQSNQCSLNTTCIYQCQAGFEPSKPRLRTCLPTGFWSLEAPICLDIDECRRSSSCHSIATCTNTVGSFTCTCIAGYTGNGQECIDINECVGSSCHSNAACTNTVGSFTCTCRAGYTGNGQKCIDLWVSQDNCQFYFSNFKSSFDVALKRCQDRNSSLTMLKTEALVFFATRKISSIYPAKKNNAFFVGLHFTQLWQWLDGYTASLSYNRKNQCGAIRGQSFVKPVSCLKPRYFICEKPVISSNQVCAPNPCRNGATCEPIGCSFKCACQENFYQRLCDSKRLDIHSPSSVSVVLGQELSLNFTIVNQDASSQHRCNLTLGGISLRTYLNKKSIIYNTTIQSSTTFEMKCLLIGSGLSITRATAVVVHIPATAHASQSHIQLVRSVPCNSARCDVTCTGVGLPLPTVSWFKNGVSVSQVSSRSVYQIGIKSNVTAYISRLILSKARFNDSGSYNCTSTNLVGSESKMIIKHITVVVQIKGPPEEDTSEKLKFSPNNNKVKFQCYFNGNPLPDLEWKFSNGSKLPSTSQFQIGKQRRQSKFQASLSLTVYGVYCRDTSFLQFQCFAKNSYSASVPSRVFIPDISIFLHFESTFRKCYVAKKLCRNRGGNLPVVSSQDALTSIKSLFGASNYGFWVSFASAKYFTDWSSDLQTADGCFYILPSTLKPYEINHIFEGALVACDVRPTPQANVTHHVDECDGTRVNISWNVQPGAESLGHRVFYEQNKSVTTPPGQSSVILTNLKPRLSYDIKVLPLFEGCSGVPLTKNHIITTGRGLLNSPISITMKKIGTVCNISWNANNIQTELGGIAIKYIEVPHMKRNDTNETISKSNRTILHKSAMQHTITELVPNTNYEVYVGAVPSRPCQDKLPVAWSKNFTGSCITEPKGPSSVPLSSKTPVSVAGGVKVFLEPVSERNGLISCYFIIARKVLNGSHNSIESNITKLRQADDVVKDGETYIAMTMTRFAQTTEVTFGDSSYSCCDVTDISDIPCSVTSSRKRRNAGSGSVVRGYNRPLTPGANYSYYVITATPVSGGSALICTASSPQGFTYRPTSEPRADVGLYVGLTLLMLAMLVILVLAFIHRRSLEKRLRRRFLKEQPVAAQTGVPLQPVRQSNNHEEDSFESDGGGSESGYPVDVNEQLSRYRIAASSLLDVYLNKRADEDRLFLDEFKTFLPEIVTKAEVKTNYAKQPQLHSKNRYRNIVPSDDARVILRKTGSDPFSSYINASFIDGYNAPSKYIAAQGPKQETVKDFWRMVVENHCTVIVMLTKLMENYKAKCERYWPEPGQEMESGPIRIVSKSETSLGDFVMRKLAVSSQRPAISIEVTQLHFMAWPDHGVPATTSSLFHIHKAAMEAQTNHSGPIVVHCSAGVGRTGTFMALDILKAELEADEEVNVLESVYRMRLHRTEMVQSLGQYVLLHKLLAEINEFGETDVDVSEFQKYTERLKIVDRTRRVTKLHLQFEQLDLVPPSLSEMKSANKPINRQLNNDSSVLPYDHSQAFVGMLSTDGEIPYLNASSVMAYNTGFYYISAQDPIEDNANSFWRCVFDNQIRVVVMLGEATCFEYWEDKNRHRCFPEFKIDTVSTCPTRYYTDRDLTLVRSGSEDAPHHVKHITYHSWKQQSSVPSVSALLDLISVIEGYQADAQEVRGKKFIALLHCSDGSSRCGVFCAVANLLERLKNENRVDVFRAVKDLRDCRSHMVGDVQQYEFCYQAVCEYLQSFDLYGNFK